MTQYQPVSQKDPEAAPAYYPPVNGSGPQTVVVVTGDDTCCVAGLWLFIAGFFCTPIFWFVGACVPGQPRTENARTWKKVNLVMTILSLISSVIVIILFATGAFVIHEEVKKGVDRVNTPPSTPQMPFPDTGKPRNPRNPQFPDFPSDVPRNPQYPGTWPRVESE